MCGSYYINLNMQMIIKHSLICGGLHYDSYIAKHDSLH